ncbi:MAG: YkgJ family cysteine cluster protein [Bacteroidetes bacterium]|nr:YkgJ family cysteine cluster protein [Bacteroidota bacterium]
MNEEYRKRTQTVQSRKREVNTLFSSISRWKPAQQNAAFHQAHEKAFEHTDCLSCARCCKETGPLFTNKDVDKLAHHLKISPGQLQDTFLRLDEDGDWVLKSTPCPFLMEDNRCSVYEARPRACRMYPHTDHASMSEVLDLTKKNARICPAVAHIVLNWLESPPNHLK